MLKRADVFHVRDSGLAGIANKAARVVGGAYGIHVVRNAAQHLAAHNGARKATRVTTHALGAEQASLVPGMGTHDHAIRDAVHGAVVDEGLERLNHLNASKLEDVEKRRGASLARTSRHLGDTAGLGKTHKATGVQATLDAAQIVHRHASRFMAGIRCVTAHP